MYVCTTLASGLQKTPETPTTPTKIPISFKADFIANLLVIRILIEMIDYLKLTLIAYAFFFL